MMEISILAALAGGLISFLSPCVLPLVPPYMTYLAGAFAGTDRGMPMIRTCASGRSRRPWCFVLGFTTVFTLLGATASAMGQLVRQYMDVFGIVAGVVIIIMGLHFLGAFRIALLYREARFQAGSKCRPLGRLCDGARLRLPAGRPCIGPDPRRHSRRGGDGSERGARRLSC